MYKKGLVSVSFRNKTPEEIVLKMKESSLSYVEWGSDVHARCDDIERLEYLRCLCKENGIVISSYGSYFRLGKDKPHDIIKYIEAAKILGTDIIRIWGGVKGFGSYTESELKELVRDAKEIAAIAEDNKVTVCLERHTGTVTDLPEGALYMMEKVASDSFLMYFQPCQFNDKEFSINYARKISKYTKVIHVFNWKENEKYPLEEACDVWREYLSEFPEDVYLLLEFMPDDRIESLETEAKALDEICKGVN